MKPNLIIVIILCAALLCGCATIYRPGITQRAELFTSAALAMVSPPSRQAEYAAAAIRLSEALYNIEATALQSPAALQAWLEKTLNVQDSALRQWLIRLAVNQLTPVIRCIQNGEKFERALETIHAISKGIELGARPFTNHP